MSILDRFRTTDEQLAPSDALDSEPDPKGEHRERENRASRYGHSSGFRFGMSRNGTVASDPAPPPSTIDEYWDEYFEGFSLTRAPLRMFSEAVVEPGYRIGATIDGEPDEDMETALDKWSSNAAIHAAETDQDIVALLRQLPAHRRGRGTVFAEKCKPDSGAEFTRALELHDPASFKIYKREDQNHLIQPDDDVDDDHPRTDDGRAAAYVQYDDALDGYGDSDEVAFAADEIVKFVFEPDTGDAWGTSIYESCGERIDSLKQKLRDRDASTRLAGHPLRVYSSEEWEPEEAKAWSEAHRDGELTSRKKERKRKRREYGTRNHDDEYDPADNPLANSTEFIGGNLNTDVVQGNVADISDAVLDDVRIIFADMPVARLKIAYEESINQWIAEPQMADDERRIDQERRYIERKLSPVVEEVADFLADGERYEGDVTFKIEPSKDDNPLNREDFPAENLNALTSSLKELYRSGASQTVINAALSYSGFDLDDIDEEFGHLGSDTDPPTTAQMDGRMLLADTGTTESEQADAATEDETEDETEGGSA